MGQPGGQLLDNGAGVGRGAYADIVALKGAAKASAMPFDCGVLTGVVHETRPMSRAKRLVSRAT